MTSSDPSQRIHSTGQMTAIMRAAKASGPKVLRVGLVQAGRVVDERVIRQRDDVWVGSSEKNLFVVAEAGLPSSFKLFERSGSGYRLNFLDGLY
jgi:hypothetical protein